LEWHYKELLEWHYKELLEWHYKELLEWHYKELSEKLHNLFSFFAAVVATVLVTSASAYIIIDNISRHNLPHSYNGHLRNIITAPPRSQLQLPRSTNITIVAVITMYSRLALIIHDTPWPSSETIAVVRLHRRRQTPSPSPRNHRRHQ